MGGHTTDIASIDFASNGTLAFAGSEDEEVRLWDVNSGSNILILDAKNRVMTVAMTDGERILAGYYDGSVWLWHIRTGTKQLITTHGSPVVSVAPSPQGSLFASASNHEKTVHIGSMAKP